MTYPNYDLRRNCQFQAQAMFFDYAAFVNLSLTNKYWSSTAQFDTLSNVNRGITTDKKFPVCTVLFTPEMLGLQPAESHNSRTP